MSLRTRTQSTIQSVDRALYLLELLQHAQSGLGVTEISRRMELAKSTVHRILTSLQNQGYVKKDAVTEKYVLGLRLIELGNIVANSLDVRSISAPLLKQLAHEMGETVHLGVLDEGDIVYIDKIEGTSYIRMASHIGKRGSVHCTGLGKAMLAFLPEDDTEKIIRTKGLKKYTEQTITTADEMFKVLQEIRNAGYATDNEEHEYGICCAAAPVFNHDGKVVAGISIAGPKIRMHGEKLDLSKQRISFNAKEISARLGYRV